MKGFIKKQNLYQNELAKLLGITENHLSNWLNKHYGINRLSRQNIEDTMRKYNTNPALLREWVNINRSERAKKMMEKRLAKVQQV